MRSRKRHDPKYLDRLRETLRANPLWPGSVNHVLVLHDDWCDLLQGIGQCNCNPEVKVLGRDN